MINKALIVDLDNTLYNWLDAYTLSFKSQILYLTENTRINETDLLNSFKRVFKKYGSVEVPNAVYELDIWRKYSDSFSHLKQLQDNSLYIFLSSWKKSIHLFPTVKETLEWAKRSNILLIGLSDAFSYWVNFRLSSLAILDLFDEVFATNDSTIYSSELVRNGIIDSRIKPIPAKINKPNTEILEMISSRNGIEKKNIFMIGDSLEKDILTAQRAGIMDIWAQYGTKHSNGLGLYLSRVTPWKKKIKNQSICPTFTVSSFSQLLEIIF